MTSPSVITPPVSPTASASYEAEAITSAGDLGFSPSQQGLLVDLYHCRERLLNQLQREGYVPVSEGNNGELRFQHPVSRVSVEVRDAFLMMQPNGTTALAGATIFISDRCPPILEQGAVKFDLLISHGVVFAAPSPACIRHVIEKSRSDGKIRDDLIDLMSKFTPQAQDENRRHEFVHVADLCALSPWGKVLLTGTVAGERYQHLAATLGEDPRGYRLRILQTFDSNLDQNLLAATPTLKQVCAARLISEMNAFAENSTTFPEIAEAAKIARTEIENALLSGEDAIRVPLQNWADFIKERGYKQIASDPEVVTIAARWIAEYGRL